jgi:hypothetical protein
MAKYMPGPWRWYWRVEDGKANCGVYWEKRLGQSYSVCRAPQYEKQKQWEANARLIAAAPELLEAARLGLAIAGGWIQSELEGTAHHQEELNRLEPIRAAIAKAEGGE